MKWITNETERKKQVRKSFDLENTAETCDGYEVLGNEKMFLEELQRCVMVTTLARALAIVEVQGGGVATDAHAHREE